MIPVVDGHHHIWRQADLPWLAGTMQPRIFGPYEPIRRDYRIEEFRADIAGSGVVKSVYVQTNWPRERYEDEAAWVERTAEATGWPHAIVAYADLSVEDVRPQLDRLSRYRLVRGVRMQLHWHENLQYRFAARRDLAADPTIRRNIGRLADYGLSFDLQVFAPQMADAADLAESCPKVVFVLQHAGMLEDLSPAGRAEWRAGMARLAACGNVVCKLSGLGHFSAPQRSGARGRRRSARRSPSSAPGGVFSDRTFRSRSSGPRMARSSTPIATRCALLRPRNSKRSCTTRR